MTLEVHQTHLGRVISEAAFDPAKWVEVCDQLARITDSDGGCIVPIDIASRSSPVDGSHMPDWIPHSTNLQGLLTRYLQGGWHKRELRARGVPAMLRHGYMTDADCISYEEIPHSDYYQDYLRNVGFRWFAGIGIRADQFTWVLTLQRKINSEPFSQSDLGPVMAYRDMLNSSAATARQLGFARMEGAACALEQHGLCAISLDASENVVQVSGTAERYLGANLHVRNGRLHAANSASEPELARLIRTVCGAKMAEPRLFVALPRGDAEPPLVLYGCILPDMACDIFRPAVGLLVISDPARTRSTPNALLMQYFDLTQTEARLAAALASGESPETFAKAHAISVITVRNHLQSLLRKTGTHRQSELVARLLRVIPLN